jgi:predicted nucleic acid-binding protein
VIAATILDTGPLVAALAENDRHHHWAIEALESIDPPLVTCEAVISECCFLLRHSANGRDAVLSLIATNLVSIDFQLKPELLRVRELMQRYEARPMSLADACLVRMAELSPAARVITLDSDFRIYRRNGRQALELIMPPSE